jgi:hypothetical protein
MSAKDVFVVDGSLPMVVVRISAGMWVNLKDVSSFDFSGPSPVLIMHNGRQHICRNFVWEEHLDLAERAAKFWEWVSVSVAEILRELV